MQADISWCDHCSASYGLQVTLTMCMFTIEDHDREMICRHSNASHCQPSSLWGTVDSTLTGLAQRMILQTQNKQQLWSFIVLCLGLVFIAKYIRHVNFVHQGNAREGRQGQNLKLIILKWLICWERGLAWCTGASDSEDATLIKLIDHILFVDCLEWKEKVHNALISWLMNKCEKLAQIC